MNKDNERTGRLFARRLSAVVLGAFLVCAFESALGLGGVEVKASFCPGSPGNPTRHIGGQPV